VLKYHGQVASVLVTKIDPSSNTAPANLVTGFKSDSYQIAGLKTAEHAIFVVSSLEAAENTTIARSVGPILKDHIERVEQKLETLLVKMIKKG